MPTKSKNAHDACEPVAVVAPEEPRFPQTNLYRDALGAFCELRIAIRRAQICRGILCRRLVLPVWGTWETTRPSLDAVRAMVDRIRPELLIGFGPRVLARK